MDRNLLKRLLGAMHNCMHVCILLLTVSVLVRVSATTPVLTINSPDGDFIDCVNIRDQPAFNHPLLRNHKIQETPAHLGKNDEDAFGWQIWHRKGTRCPVGTIPIRRLNGTTGSQAEVEATLGHEYAIGSLGSPPPKIYGTKVIMNVWQPKVEQTDEFSLGQVWVNSAISTISRLAGRFIPKPRLFIFWTADAYTLTTCYNLRCPGFVQTSPSIVIEGAISPTSVFGGAQMELSIQIWKEPKPGPWWLGVGFSNGTVLALVGYWPTEIFTRLTEYATNVEWGGEIVNKNISGRHTITQMGSGYLPENAKAAYMKDLQIAVNIRDFQPVNNLMVKVTNPAYYSVEKFNNTSFSYGGSDSEHAGAVYLRLSSILLCLCFGLFLLF